MLRCTSCVLGWLLVGGRAAGQEMVSRSRWDMTFDGAASARGKRVQLPTSPPYDPSCEVNSERPVRCNVRTHPGGGVREAQTLFEGPWNSRGGHTVWCYP